MADMKSLPCEHSCEVLLESTVVEGWLSNATLVGTCDVIGYQLAKDSFLFVCVHSVRELWKCLNLRISDLL